MSFDIRSWWGTWSKVFSKSKNISFPASSCCNQSRVVLISVDKADFFGWKPHWQFDSAWMMLMQLHGWIWACENAFLGLYSVQTIGIWAGSLRETLPQVDLERGTTWETFQSLGSWPVRIEWLNNSVTEGAIALAVCFNMWAEMASIGSISLSSVQLLQYMLDFLNNVKNVDVRGACVYTFIIRW